MWRKWRLWRKHLRHSAISATLRTVSFHISCTVFSFQSTNGASISARA